MAKPVTIGKHKFPSQKAAKELADDIRQRTWKGRKRSKSLVPQFVPVKNREDHKFLKALCKRHPDYRVRITEAKTYGPVKGFSVGKDPACDVLCLWFRNEDGEARVKFSAARAVANNGENK